FIFLGQRKLVAHLFTDNRRRFLIDDLVDSRHGAHLHHHFNHFRCLNSHFSGQLSNSDGFTNFHFTLNRLRRFIKAMLHTGWCLFLLHMTVSAVKRFFVIGIIFFLAFDHRRFLTGSTTAGTLFFSVDFVFSLLSKLVAGQVIIIVVCWLGFFFLRPALAVFFCQFTCRFSLFGRFLLQLT